MHLLSNQRKYLIIAGLLLLGVLLYKFAVQNSVELFFKNRELTTQLKKVDHADNEMAVLVNKIDALNSKLSRYTIDSLKNKENIFDIITGFCVRNNINLREMPSEGVSDYGDYIIETNKVVAEGNFINLTRLIYFVEHESVLGRVSSVKYHMYHDHQKNRDVLLLNLYVQNIVIK